MNEGNGYELHGTDYKITWHETTTSRIDMKALKKDLPDVAAKYTKESKSRRFLLS
jgi:predicted phage-related endonuclease